MKHLVNRWQKIGLYNSFNKSILLNTNTQQHSCPNNNNRQMNDIKTRLTSKSGRFDWQTLSSEKQTNRWSSTLTNRIPLRELDSTTQLNSVHCGFCSIRTDPTDARCKFHQFYEREDSSISMLENKHYRFSEPPPIRTGCVTGCYR